MTVDRSQRANDSAGRPPSATSPAWDVDLRRRVDSQSAHVCNSDQALPKQFRTAIEFFDSKKTSSESGESAMRTVRPKDVPKESHGTEKQSDRVIHVKTGEQLESLKIEKGMKIKLDPGAHYKIRTGLQLPEGASIIGDKNNPPSIDYVGSTVNANGKNKWPACITVNGGNATIDGVKLECSGMKMSVKGGANGIWANEGADNLNIKNCTAGKLETFIHLNGADRVTIDNCSAKSVNSYFLWNEVGSDYNTVKNSRCDDSLLEWTVRSYGRDLVVDNSTIKNYSRPGGPIKGALAIYNGSATVRDSTIDGGIRIGPLNGPVHGVQYIDPENKDRLRDDLSKNERKAANILDHSASVHATGNKIIGWINLNQNADVLFENNDIHRPSAENGSFAVFTEYREEYSGFRKPAQGRFINNRFSGPIREVFHNQPHGRVQFDAENTLNGKHVFGLPNRIHRSQTDKFFREIPQGPANGLLPYIKDRSSLGKTLERLRATRPDDESKLFFGP